ncbi:MAG: hypothetical protein HY400_06520 [Elusimicrobia bacterium]|nr:hypothetical protein [Elusimicrobiota bacterium]
MKKSFYFLPTVYFLLSTFLFGCVGPRVAVKRDFDFSKVQRIAVTSFDGEGGEAASDLLAHALLASGADVVERKKLDSVLREHRLAQADVFDPKTMKSLKEVLGVDALFVGSVTQYSAPESYLVYTGTGAGHRKVTPLKGRSLYPQGTAIGVPDSSILTSAAVVGLNCRMVDVRTGSVVWSAHETYEGIDLETATISLAESFVHSLRSFWPTLSRK